MPNLNVYLVEGFAPERKTALLKRMTDAIVTTIGAPREAVRIFLIELARAHVCVGGVTLLEADLPGGRCRRRVRGARQVPDSSSVAGTGGGKALQSCPRTSVSMR